MKTTPAPTASPHSSRASILAGILLAAAAFLAFHNTFAVPFFFDDITAISENQTIRHVWRAGDWISPPRDGSGVTGRPLVNLSFAINYAIGGTNPAGYHALNLILHIGAALALFGIVRGTLSSGRLNEGFRRHATHVAFLATLSWVVHPLQTESVNCVVQRTEILVGLFYLLTLYAFVRSIKHPGFSLWSGLSVLACFFGMASKEVMVSAPLMVLLYDRTFIAGSFAAAWRLRRAYYLQLASSWLLLAVILVSMGGSRGSAAGFGLGITWWSYSLKQCEAILLYLRLCFWPHPLVLDYGTAVVRNPLEVLPQAIALSALVGIVVSALWRRPWLGFIGMWFFAILAPSSSVVPLVSQTIAEHRMYLPLAAVTTLVAVSLYAVAGIRPLGFLLIACAGLGAVTVRRNLDYQSEISIWSVTIAQRPENARAYSNLGNAYKALGRHEDAARFYEEALKRDPNQSEAFNNLAALDLEAGRVASAVTACEAALRLNPNFADALNNLGSARSKLGQHAEALALFERAVRQKPTLAPAQSNFSGALLAAGRVDEAIVHGKIALELHPGSADAQTNLGNALLTAGRPAEAIYLYEAALRTRQNDAITRCNLGSALYRSGRPQEAIPHYEAALRIAPDNFDAHNNLASALFQTGSPADAVIHYRESIRLSPDSAEARANLGLVLTRLGRIPEAIIEYEELRRRTPAHAGAMEALARLRSPSPSIPPK